jgi:hypothetical protein
MRQFNKQKILIYQKLANELSDIYICTDLWRGPNIKEFLVIIAKGINTQGNAFHFLLSLKKLKGNHASKDQALFVLIVIKDFNIQKN